MSKYRNNLQKYLLTLECLNSSSFESKIINIANIIKKNFINRKKIIVIGNGGSSAMSDHFVTELTCKYKKLRKPYNALTLNLPSSITAWSNDFEFKSFYSRQIDALGNKGDILLILTTSGGTINKQSSNLFLAAKSAKKKGIKIFTLSGKKKGSLDKLSDQIIKVKSNETPVVQLAHQFILDQFCEILN